MRAALLQEYGPPENLRVEQTEPPGPLKSGQVRIDVHASSINPIDWKIRAGKQRGAIRYTLPRALGMDFSGVVSEVHGSVSTFALGDAVFGSPGHLGPGCYAEQTVASANEIALKPARLSHVEAATLPLVGLTAWQCLMPMLQQRAGCRVFIMAGSGGVGSFAIQLARHHGAWVATTASERNHELVTRLGADLAIDYHSTRFEDVLSDLDLVLDSMGHEHTTRALALVKRGGRLSNIVSGLPENSAKWGPNLGVVVTGLGIVGLKLKGWMRGIDASTVVKRARGDELAEISDLVEQGLIQPVIDTTFPLDQIAEAHRYGETGRIRGKVAITIREG